MAKRRFFVSGKEHAKLQAEYGQIAPHAELARQIGKRVAGMQIDGSQYAAAIEALTEEQQTKLVQDTFANMPPAEKFKRLAAVFTDTALEAMLAQEHRRAREYAVYDAKIEAATGQAEEYHYLDLTGLPKRAALEINLYGPQSFTTNLGLPSVAEVPARILYLGAEGDGNFVVLGDHFPNKTNFPAPPLDLHSRVRVGVSNVGRREDVNPIDPCLYLATPLGVSLPDSLHPTEVDILGYEDALRNTHVLRIGNVAIDGQTVLS